MTAIEEQLLNSRAPDIAIYFHTYLCEGLITEKISYKISKSWDFAKDFRISGKISRFQSRFQDFSQDFKISLKILRFHLRFQDFT